MKAPAYCRLGESGRNLLERSAEMVGALPYEVEMLPRPQGHGYVVAETCGQNPFMAVGTRFRGHEFHHSQIRYTGRRPEAVYRLERGTGLGGSQDGLVYRNVLAAYTHLHAGACADWAPGIVRAARSNPQGMGSGFSG